MAHCAGRTERVSQGDEATGREPSDIGLALLLDGGVADAITSVEGMIATAQSGVVRALAGLSQVQAAGAAAASIPMAPPVATQATVKPQEAASDIVEAVRPAALLAPPPAVRSARAEQVSMAPVTVPGGGSVAPSPVVRTEAPDDSAPMLFSSFAPTPVAETEIAVMSDRSTVSAKDLAAPATSGLGGDTLAVSSVRPRQWAPEASSPATQTEGPATDALPQRAFAPTPRQPLQGGPTGGDVFLDGARVGSWMADHLAHEVGRPQAGGTGFDPRLTPAWPGTLQGG